VHESSGRIHSRQCIANAAAKFPRIVFAGARFPSCIMQARAAKEHELSARPQVDLTTARMDPPPPPPTARRKLAHVAEK